MNTYQLRHYLTNDGTDPYQQWLDGLRDRTAKLAAIRRATRLERGLFGDCKPLQEGVWEARIDVGAGYRVYYAIVGEALILLTNGGDKRTQDADIARAIGYLKDWRKRNET
jgi:putative addiction module killer protein